MTEYGRIDNITTKLFWVIIPVLFAFFITAITSIQDQVYSNTQILAERTIPVDKVETIYRNQIKICTSLELILNVDVDCD